MINSNRSVNYFIAFMIALGMALVLGFLVYNIEFNDYFKPQQESVANLQTDADESDQKLYDVIEVIDGDTIKVNYEGKEESVRLIGVNTPETVDPRIPAECFGQEASEFLKTLLADKKVSLAVDSTQGDRDKYNRLLRYVALGDQDVSKMIIESGYGEEYTYETDYARQSEYRAAQEQAKNSKKGLWADGVCESDSSETDSAGVTDSAADTSVVAPITPVSTSANSDGNSQNDCKIKGNISSSGEKIYHLPGQKYYDSTRIDVSAGEKWFCSEAEAQAAGWRQSKV